MIQEDILEMAREAGYQHRNAIGQSELFEYFDLEHFASLVIAAEREACAADCDAAADRLAACPASPENRAAISALRHRAAVIRARGNAL